MATCSIGISLLHYFLEIIGHAQPPKTEKISYSPRVRTAVQSVPYNTDAILHHMWQSQVESRLVESEHYSVTYLNALLCSKRCTSELPLRAGLMCCVDASIC